MEETASNVFTCVGFGDFLGEMDSLLPRESQNKQTSLPSFLLSLPLSFHPLAKNASLPFQLQEIREN